MATHSSILAWRILWTEEPGRLQSTGSQSRTRLSDFTHTHTQSCHIGYWFSFFLCLLLFCFISHSFCCCTSNLLIFNSDISFLNELMMLIIYPLFFFLLGVDSSEACSDTVLERLEGAPLQIYPTPTLQLASLWCSTRQILATSSTQG